MESTRYPKHQKKKWPKNIDDAAYYFIGELHGEAREAFPRKGNRKELSKYHFTSGLWIRNNYGLWGGNFRLMADCGCRHQDDCSMMVLVRASELLTEEDAEKSGRKDTTASAAEY